MRKQCGNDSESARTWWVESLRLWSRIPSAHRGEHVGRGFVKGRVENVSRRVYRGIVHWLHG